MPIDDTFESGQTLRGSYRMFSLPIQQLTGSRVLLAVLALFWVGCATPPVIPPGTQCEVIGTHAPFYKYGPAQNFGADEIIPQGTTVTLLDRGYGFSRVMRPNGLTGYVATEDLQPMAPEPARKAPPRLASNRKVQRTYTGPVKRSNVTSTPGDPLFDVNDVPLPSKEPPAKPEATPAPQP